MTAKPYRIRQVSGVVLGALILSAAILPPRAWAQVPFTAQEHCVAYRTVKGMFWMFDSEIVGKSCAVEARLLPGTRVGTVQVQVQVPILSFDSDNSSRDEHVAEILNAAKHPSMRFTSEPLPLTVAQAALEDGELKLPGTLSLAGQSHAVTFALRAQQAEASPAISGSLRTTFHALGITVPSVGPGGMIAAPGETLELWVHLQLKQVAGAEALLAPQVSQLP